MLPVSALKCFTSLTSGSNRTWRHRGYDLSKASQLSRRKTDWSSVSYQGSRFSHRVPPRPGAQKEFWPSAGSAGNRRERYALNRRAGLRGDTHLPPRPSETAAARETRPGHASSCRGAGWERRPSPLRRRGRAAPADVQHKPRR